MFISCNLVSRKVTIVVIIIMSNTATTDIIMTTVISQLLHYNLHFHPDIIPAVITTLIISPIITLITVTLTTMLTKSYVKMFSTRTVQTRRFLYPAGMAGPVGYNIQLYRVYVRKSSFNTGLALVPHCGGSPSTVDRELSFSLSKNVVM